MPARRGDSTFSTLGVPAFLEYVRQAGGDADALRQRFRLPEDPQAQMEVRFTFTRFRQFSEAAAEEAGDECLGLHVVQTLTESLREGRPTLVHVARRMHMSERTLQRRLVDAGTSFQELLDGTRRTLARAYLADPRLSLAEVAYRLGYADLRAFVRGFKRWTGTTPGKLRGSAE